MSLIERIKQMVYEWKLSRQHRNYLKTQLDGLTDPTLLDRMHKGE